MSKLIITIGLPRSGKTTWAKEFMKQSGNAVRVNRDDLRAMLHDGKWTRRNEELTIKVQTAIVETALKQNKVVIVDDTNLTQHHKDKWSNVAKACGASFEIKKMEMTDIDELIARDNHAPEHRGAHVIIDMALRNKLLKFDTDSIVLCDLDGTIADCSNRRHHVAQAPKDWKSFFDEMDQDPAREEVANLVRAYIEADKQIIFVTARPEDYREKTTRWLESIGFSSVYDAAPIGNKRYAALLMRPSGDSRQDNIVKKEILDKYLEKNWIHAVIDDRPIVIQMWKDAGLNVIDVGNGEDF